VVFVLQWPLARSTIMGAKIKRNKTQSPLQNKLLHRRRHPLRQPLSNNKTSSNKPGGRGGMTTNLSRRSQETWWYSDWAGCRTSTWWCSDWAGGRTSL